MPLQEAFSHICEVVTPSSSARDELILHLRNGTIQGRAARSPTSSERQAGNMQPIEMSLGPDFWKKAEILFVPDNKWSGASLNVIGPKPLNNVNWSVHLDRASVMEQFPSVSGNSASSAPASSKMRLKSGPKHFEWELCAIAVMLRCIDDGEPKSVKELMEYARDWFGDGDVPGDTVLRGHMTTIFEALKTRKPPKPP
jgi:hypothetical protein